MTLYRPAASAARSRARFASSAAALCASRALSPPRRRARRSRSSSATSASRARCSRRADEFAKRANAKLGGKAKVVVFGSSQLGGDKEMMQKLKLGTLDMALPSTVMSSEVDLFGVFEMPYLVKDRAHMGRIEKEIFWPKLAPEAEKKGLKVLAVWENGYRHITNSKRPIKRARRPARASSCACPEGKWRVKMFQAYGANPSPMKFSELFTALQTGVMDGQENPFTQIYSAKLQEVQKYLSLSGHVYTPAYLTVGKNEVGRAAGRRAQGPRGHGEGDAGVRLRDAGEGRRRAARPS